MRQVTITEFMNQPFSTQKDLKLINIRGCNGAGKSTIPIMMTATDPNTFEITWKREGKTVVIATVCPKFNFLLFGHYHSKTGGLDTIRSTEEVKEICKLFWNVNMNILLEGILASTVRQTYIDLFQTCNNENPTKREIIIYNL